MQGYFLEPKTDYDLATTRNSDTAIMPGTYNITPKWHEDQKYEWYLETLKEGQALLYMVEETAITQQDV